MSEAIILEESHDDLIGTIELFYVMENGDVVVTDGTRPDIRRFGADGRLVARHGSYGSGPFEFRRIRGVVEDEAGGLVVVDPQLARFTRFEAPLEPDTVFESGVLPLGPVKRLGAGFLLLVAPGLRTVRAVVVEDLTRAERVGREVELRQPEEIGRNPYWGSYARTLVTASETEIMVASSFLYPIYISDAAGFLVDSLVTPPPSFRIAPVLHPGALAGEGGAGRRRSWMAEFDVIADMRVLDDTLLVVVHGSLVPSEGTAGTPVDHSRLDLYHLPSRRKIASDLLLPEGVTVLGGSATELFLLMSGPPEPWGFARATVSPPASRTCC